MLMAGLAVVTEPEVEPCRQSFAAEEPQWSKQQYNADRCNARRDDGRRRIGTEASNNRGELLSDQDEDGALEQVLDQVPHRAGLQARGSALYGWTLVGEPQSCDDDRKHAGSVNTFRGQVGGERGCE